MNDDIQPGTPVTYHHRSYGIGKDGEEVIVASARAEVRTHRYIGVSPGDDNCIQVRTHENEGAELVQVRKRDVIRVHANG